MVDRVSSDNDSILTIRAVIERAGSTKRPELQFPATAFTDCSLEPVIRVDIDDTTYHAVPVIHGDIIRISGCYDNSRLARQPDNAPNHLHDWLSASNLTIGRTVLIDIIVPGYHYGLRQPGTTATYTPIHPPTDSLQQIAANLDDTDPV